MVAAKRRFGVSATQWFDLIETFQPAVYGKWPLMRRFKEHQGEESATRLTALARTATVEMKQQFCVNLCNG